MQDGGLGDARARRGRPRGVAAGRPRQRRGGLRPAPLTGWRPARFPAQAQDADARKAAQGFLPRAALVVALVPASPALAKRKVPRGFFAVMWDRDATKAPEATATETTAPASASEELTQAYSKFL